MNANLLVLALAAIIPMITGFIWYNEKVFGKAWKAATGLTDDKLKSGNMALIFGLSYLFSFFLAFGLYSVVVHQGHVMSILLNEPGFNDAGSEINKYFTDFMAKFGTNFRTFKHGVLHGVIGGLMLALPILATNALFERKGFKYVAINVGYWVLTMALMGGVICQFA
jgi:hypothetical protein